MKINKNTFKKFSRIMQKKLKGKKIEDSWKSINKKVFNNEWRNIMNFQKNTCNYWKTNI